MTNSDKHNKEATTTKILDGLSLAKDIRQHISDRVKAIIKEHKRAPSVYFIRVGDNPASEIYVNAKQKACTEVGFSSKQIHLPENISERELSNEIIKLNKDTTIDGILLQLPLPKQLTHATNNFISLISPDKDVDGLHPINIGKLWSTNQDKDNNNNDTSFFIPCTPKGIIRILDEHNINLEGADTVIIGRSNLVSKPLAALLLNRNATVTITHSKTKNIKSICKKADIIICAVGKAELVDKDWIKNGATVIDVGINRVEGSNHCTIKGDVNFESIKNKASHITPVPGGVGPMTIASLLENVLKAFLRKVEKNNQNNYNNDNKDA